MESKTQQQLTRKLLGYFMVDGISSGCLIVDSLYSRESLYYPTGDEEYPQHSIPVDEADILPGLPRFYELGYIPVGVEPSFELSYHNRQEKEIHKFVDIPVYAISQDDWLTSIAVEIEEWIPALKILDEEQYEEIIKKTYSPEFYDLMADKQSLRRHLFGYVTATGGVILICDTDFVRMCREYDNWIDDQITVSADGEASPGFRVGVNAHIPEELRNREFPVYGEYEGDLLKRITIEIVNAN
jgi:hypothetical protein